MTFLFGTRKRKVTSAVVTLFLIAGGTALAAWLIHGHGQGTVGLGNLQAPNVTQGTITTRDCFPGDTCDGYFKVTNPNAKSLVVTGSVNGDNTGSTSNQLCDYHNLTVQTVTGLAIPIPNGATEVKIPRAFSLSADAGSACQGETITRDVDLTFST